jgi:hypothetical protein
MSGNDHVTRVERLIRDAEAAGEFDNLPGSGKPIDDLDQPYEPEWWARRFAARQRLGDDAVDLATRLRRELPRILASRNDAAVRADVEALNVEIARLSADLPESERRGGLDVDRLLADRGTRHSHEDLT